jgi:hypothetical protein
MFKVVKSFPSANMAEVTKLQYLRVCTSLCVCVCLVFGIIITVFLFLSLSLYSLTYTLSLYSLTYTHTLSLSLSLKVDWIHSPSHRERSRIVLAAERTGGQSLSHLSSNQSIILSFSLAYSTHSLTDSPHAHSSLRTFHTHPYTLNSCSPTHLLPHSLTQNTLAHKHVTRTYTLNHSHSYLHVSVHTCTHRATSPCTKLVLRCLSLCLLFFRVLYKVFLIHTYTSREGERERCPAQHSCSLIIVSDPQ